MVDVHIQHQNVDAQSVKLQANMPSGIFVSVAQERQFEQIVVDVGDAMNTGISVVF